MAEADLPFLEKNFIKTLNTKNISNCLIMQDYCNHLESLGLSFPKAWKEEFFNETLELSNLLLEDRHERRMLDMGYEEYNQYRHKSLVEHFSGVSMNDFIEKCKMLHQVLSGRDRDYSLKTGLEMCLRALFEVAPEIYPELVSKYLEYDDHFEINPHFVVSNLFNILSSSEVLSLLSNRKFRYKKLWLSAYFAQFPEESITKNESVLLVEHISNTPSNELHGWLDYLDKYKHVDCEIYSKLLVCWCSNLMKTKTMQGRWSTCLASNQPYLGNGLMSSCQTRNWFLMRISLDSI